MARTRVWRRERATPPSHLCRCRDDLAPQSKEPSFSWSDVVPAIADSSLIFDVGENRSGLAGSVPWPRRQGPAGPRQPIRWSDFAPVLPPEWWVFD
jgi:hypothetical protein